MPRFSNSLPVEVGFAHRDHRSPKGRKPVSKSELKHTREFKKRKEALLQEDSEDEMERELEDDEDSGIYINL